jgi:hypothetical protein
MRVKVTFDNGASIDYIVDVHMSVNNFIRLARWYGIKRGVIPGFDSKITNVQFL